MDLDLNLDLDIPIIMGIAVTKSVVICCVGVALTLVMLIVLLVTLSNGKVKEKRMIEAAANSKSVRTARSKSATGKQITSQPVVRSVPNNRVSTSAPKQADDLTMAVNESELVGASEGKTSEISVENTAELTEDTSTLSVDNTAEL